MILLRADSLEQTRELGVQYLNKEGPVLLMNKIYIENPEILDWRKKSLMAVIDTVGNNEALH